MGSSAGLFVNFEDDQKKVQINIGSHWNNITWSNLVQVNLCLLQDANSATESKPI